MVATEPVLAKLDDATFQWFHVKAILVSGIGFFTDAYDLFMVSVVSPMIAFSHFPTSSHHGKYGVLPKQADLAVKGTALVGTLIGQLVFGVLGDASGRKKVYGITLLLMIVATLMTVLTSVGPPDVMIAIFCFWRLVLGLGIGGDYPLSAVITSEYSSRLRRGTMIAAVFSMQGLGIIAASLVALAVTKAFEGSIQQCQVGVACKPLDTTWRVCVGLGALPAAATWYLRTRLPETPRFTLHVQQDTAKAAQDVDNVIAGEGQVVDTSASVSTRRITWRDFHNYATQRHNLTVLTGACLCWFLLDVAFYSQNLFLPAVLADTGYNTPVSASASGQDIYTYVYNVAAGNAAVAMMGTVPGYWFAVALIDVMGRKPMQYLGFGAMTVLLLVGAAAFDALRATSSAVFLLLYALIFFFANFGPNTTTFVVPGECFPTRFRSTAHGISAASGKLGAIVGSFGFGALALSAGTRVTLGMLSLFMLAGVAATALIPETKGVSLEELGEDKEHEGVGAGIGTGTGPGDSPRAGGGDGAEEALLQGGPYQSLAGGVGGVVREEEAIQLVQRGALASA